MEIELFKLPVDNITEIERTLCELERLRREQTNLPPEVIDWYDYANGVLQTEGMSA